MARLTIREFRCIAVKSALFLKNDDFPVGRNMESRCIICGAQAEIKRFPEGRDTVRYACEKCGEFELTRSLNTRLQDGDALAPECVEFFRQAVIKAEIGHTGHSIPCFDADDFDGIRRGQI